MPLIVSSWEQVALEVSVQIDRMFSRTKAQARVRASIDVKSADDSQRRGEQQTIEGLHVVRLVNKEEQQATFVVLSDCGFAPGAIAFAPHTDARSLDEPQICTIEW